jgi:hypothetical protein
MPFDVYPIAHTDPQVIPSMTSSAAVALTERYGGDNWMWIRVAMTGSGCSPAAAPPQTIFLRAGSGTLTEICTGVEIVAIHNGTTNVANAYATHEANGVVLVKVFRVASAPAQTWQISIRNNDAVSHDFVWVGATTDAESRQPWMHVSPSIDDAFLVGQGGALAQAIHVQNKGTGDLGLTDPVGTSLGSGLTLTGYSATGPTVPPAGCVDISISTAPPGAAGQLAVLYDVPSTDSLAQTTTGTMHNRHVEIGITASKVEIVLLLDGSGSMNDKPDGSSTSDFEQKRWGLLYEAVEEFFTFIVQLGMAYGASVGTFGVAVFANHVAQTIDGATKKELTDTGKINSVLAALAARPPSGGTPMGEGIKHTLGPLVNTSDFFAMDATKDVNRRWLVLMSDGAHNQGTNPDDFCTTANNFGAKNVRAFTIAYGAPSAPEFEPGRLTTIAACSSGIAHVADTIDGEFAVNLKKAFRNALIEGLHLGTIFDPRGVLSHSIPEVRRSVSITPYDRSATFIVNWQTFDADRVSVQILTPNCELITPAVAQADPHVAYDGASRSAMFTFDSAFLRNDGDPTNSRDGTWTLVISSDLESGSEPIAFDILVDSTLRMDVEYATTPRYAGDDLSLIARLTADGLPILNASVTMSVTRPGAAVSNWLAAELVTQDEFAKAKETLGADGTFYAIKSRALRDKGVQFPGFTHHEIVDLVDDDGDGQYRATVASAITGAYELHVVAIGETESGVQFRRERILKPYLDVRPDPTFSFLNVIYGQAVEGGVLSALLTLTLKDKNGSLVLLDPAANPAIAVTVAGGQLTGPLEPNLNGTYSQPISYDATSSPTVTVHAGDEVIVPSHRVAPVGALLYADNVVGFELGGEASPGLNAHREPKDALGDITKKPADSFVSLGATGSIELGVKGQAILPSDNRDQDDIIVFTHPDTEPRSYRVDALARGRWQSLGDSHGVSQGFSISAAGLRFVEAVRITDTSGLMIDTALNPTTTPGVSLSGIGFAKVGTAPPEPRGCLGWLAALLTAIRRLVR